MRNSKKHFLYDVETDLLTETAFSLLVKETERRNNELYERGEDKRASYSTLSYFIEYMFINERFKKYIEESKIIIRKDKLNKIINGI